MSQSFTVALSGSTGFIGSYLASYLKNHNISVIKLTRDDFRLTPEKLGEKISGLDGIINLAGAPIIKRWTEEYKKILYRSRIDTTRKLVNACSLAKQQPKLFLSTSAIGYYDSVLLHTEEHYGRSEDFLGTLTGDWEKEALEARALGMRTVIFRFGVVLGKNGGALKSMLLPFKLGLGGIIGSGEQAVSWIHIEDIARACLSAINDSSFGGAYNLTAPTPSTNRELSRTLGKLLHRPVFFPVSECAVKLLYGEGAQVLIKGQQVLPKRLQDAGFKFKFSVLEAALADCLK
ncbi:MAG: TIGR01777 family oxidoreductase [Desulfobulbaceae bacterium]|nr:TIGR01777 family oxidoreductase [Desulfobulbaceae bacterium]